MITKRIFSLCIHALVFTLLALPGFAADFYAIVDDFGRRARTARLDFAFDTRAGVGVNVQFNVYDRQGTQVTEFFLPSNVNGFVSTESFGNLFDLTGGQPMLIRARTAGTIELSSATLYIDSAGAPLTIGIPPGVGGLFSLALGNFRSASLLISNVSGAQVTVDVFKGTNHAPGSGIYSNPRVPNYGQWRVELTQNEALSHLIVQASGSCLVQVVIDDGRSIQSFMVTPVF
jgi:hypothetical protein